MEIYINKDFSRHRIDFYLVEKAHLVNRFYSLEKNGSLRQVEADPMVPISPDIKPLISLPANIGQAFIELVAEYAKNEGVTIKEQSNMAGKISAIEKHNEFLTRNLEKMIDFAITPPQQINDVSRT